MRCPFCSHDDSQVKDSRPTEDGASIRRRRQCEGCGARFTTFERVQLRDLTVVKKDGGRESFDRAKIERSIAIACRKREIEPARLDRLVSAIQRQVETSGEQRNSLSQAIGESGDGGPEGARYRSPISASPASIRTSAKPSDFEDFAGSGRRRKKQLP